MPSRRRPTQEDAAQTPRRSERIRLQREATEASGSSGHQTPPNMAVANASHLINAPRVRLRTRRMANIDMNLVAQAAAEGAVPSPPVRQRGLLGTLRYIIGTGFIFPRPENAANSAEAGIMRTSTPVPGAENNASNGIAVVVSPSHARPSPPTASHHRAVVGRLKRELTDFGREPTEGCTIQVVGDNLFHWRATISGPPETPYAGGQFHLDLHFSHDYPFAPPKVYFLTKIYHCNIAATGYICLDILNRQWSPALTVSKMLLSIISLLSDPNPEDPLDPTIASIYKSHRSQHDVTARSWTALYAKPGQGPPIH